MNRNDEQFIKLCKGAIYNLSKIFKLKKMELDKYINLVDSLLSFESVDKVVECLYYLLAFEKLN